ncbi:MAG: SDR family oxidoreductase [Proteobacteria bacterium]|nr:SDR family oxidoreductase [Pseudomonadota bacterium]
MYANDALNGSTILITGGGTGLGRAMAERFAGVGAAVAVLGRREDPLAETVAAIQSAGGTAAYAAGADVRDPASLEAAVASLEEEVGPINGLVNNAAGNFLCASEDLSANAFNSVVQIVLYGTFHATQALGRRWIERGSGGVMLNISTTYAWTGSSFVLPSACAKAGVLAMTRSLAVEWATYGIRANAIAPGPIPTEGAFSRLMPPGAVEAHAKQRIPLGRLGTREELADLATFLMSPMASWITGEVVTIDGGEVLKAGGEFNGFTDHPREQFKAALASMRPSK